MTDRITSDNAADLAARYNQLPPPNAETQFNVDRQNARNLHNVAGDQYIHYLQTVHAQRESFLREIAASRTRSRRVMRFGFLVFLAGFGTYLVMAFRFLSRIGEPGTSEHELMNEIWGEEIGGAPIMFIALGVAIVGMVIMIVGIVGHVVAASRQRRVESQPVYPPGPPNGPFPPMRGR
jgi:hypothetical protein